MMTRQEMANTPVTLDGVKAKVCGTLNDYATVRDAKGVAYEWSWETVEHIITSKGGRFTS